MEALAIAAFVVVAIIGIGVTILNLTIRKR